MTKPPSERLLVCDCQRTMEIDGDALARALGQSAPLTVHTELCRGQVAAFERALAEGGSLRVACTQESPLFREVAAEKGAGESDLHFTNIRERAGWCNAKGGALPKMAALLAEAAYPEKPTGTRALTSRGQCLVYGAGETALEAARELGERLGVTVLLSEVGDAVPPARASVPIYKGRIRSATGHLGAFEVTVDGYAAILPSSRRTLEFVMPRDGARAECDLIFDLSGRTPLFADSSRRDGYVRADPNNPAAVAKAMLKAIDLVGEFEKPLYVTLDTGICAHARSGKVGCTNCLDNCPTGAITSAGDHVAVDAAICGGCGNCSAVCPTGAVSYAYPDRADLIGRAQRLVKAYLGAGGTRPVLLIHDERHGDEIVGAMARFGHGLPPNVLPLAVYSVTQLGHEALISALVSGFVEVAVLAPPDRPEELPALEAQAELVEAFLVGLGYSGRRVTLLSERDPDIVEERLYGLEQRQPIASEPFEPTGSKREVARIGIAKLQAVAPSPRDVIELPKGAPYGRINVRTEGCTLCLACVGACPVNALSDNPDRPQLAFTEAACVQCGICVATCPEKVISLTPRYDFTSAALGPVVVKTEEPFACVVCGKPFGTKATIARVVERLKGRHAMFQNEDQVRLIQMCDTCRVVAVAEAGNDPLRYGERPRVRTTDDYLAEREANPKSRKPDDFLG